MALAVTLFTIINRLLVFFTGYSIGAATRIQWQDTGLMAKMESVLALRVLGFIQLCLSSSLIAETVIWMTVRLFGQHDFYLVGEPSFTMQGVELINDISTFAIIGWAFARLLPEEKFQRVWSHPTMGSMLSKLASVFWLLNTVIALQVYLSAGSVFGLLSFCTLRIIVFSTITSENPGWHLLAYFALCLLGNPIRPDNLSPLLMDAINTLKRV